MKNRLLLIVMCMLAGSGVYAQTPLTGRDTSIRGPQTFAIVVGISHYRYIRQLAYADKDAELFRDWLRSPAGGKLKDQNIYCLLNEEATNANFWGKGFQWLRSKQLKKGDKLFIYLAGHGDAIDEDQYFFLGYDCNPEGDKNNYLVSGAIQLFNLKKKIADETSKKVDVIFVMDACRSNELPGGTPGQNFLNTAISEKKAGEIMMLATAAGQVSVEDASIGNGHGLFTWYLIDGLTGEADALGKADRKITFGEIKQYVDNNVATLALERFKRKQEPYFCCNENTEKVISIVDTAYLQQWLKIKKQQERRSGRNSLDEDPNLVDDWFADTALVETYNRFNRAVKNNRLTGSGSAEEYFIQLNGKYPGNPYTLDAKSTLAVEYLNAAQTRVNRYLSCITDISPTDKQANYEAALNLEKAIASFREDDEGFARSLYGRLWLLKASGDLGENGKNGNLSEAFRYAYNGLAFESNGAYILNRLAQLHLQNNNRDSAAFYAKKATQIAPKWNCALTTLALIQNTVTNIVKPDSTSKRNKSSKPHFGLVTGGGMNSSNPTRADISPNNPVTNVAAKSAPDLNFGMLYFIGLSKSISIRPAASLGFKTTSVEFQRRDATGGNIITETIKMDQTNISLALPFVFNFSTNKISPYITGGPGVSFLIGQDADSKSRLPVKSLQTSGDLGLGVDILLKKVPLVFSPELKYSYGFTELKKASSTIYSNGLSSLKQHGFKLTVYLRSK